jgi:MbtH protein
MGSWPRRRYFRVVINGEAQYGIWPADSALPAGWQAVGFVGSRPSCLDFVAEVWRDMRPLSVKSRDVQASDRPSLGEPDLAERGEEP